MSWDIQGAPLYLYKGMGPENKNHYDETLVKLNRSYEKIQRKNVLLRELRNIKRRKKENPSIKSHYKSPFEAPDTVVLKSSEEEHGKSNR